MAPIGRTVERLGVRAARNHSRMDITTADEAYVKDGYFEWEYKETRSDVDDPFGDRTDR